MTCGAYLLMNTVTRKPYVGASVNVERRWRVHKCELRGGKHCNSKLQRAWDKYGEKAFDFSLLEECDRTDLVGCEQNWIDRYGAMSKGYNILSHARSTQGRKFSAEALIKLRDAARKAWGDPEQRSRMSDRIRESQNRPHVREAKSQRAREQWKQGNIGR